MKQLEQIYRSNEQLQFDKKIKRRPTTRWNKWKQRIRKIQFDKSTNIGRSVGNERLKKHATRLFQKNKEKGKSRG